MSFFQGLQAATAPKVHYDDAPDFLRFLPADLNQFIILGLYLDRLLVYIQFLTDFSYLRGTCTAHGDESGEGGLYCLALTFDFAPNSKCHFLSLAAS